MRERVELALVGATGAVGGAVLEGFELEQFPLSGLRLFASPESEGLSVDALGDELVVEPLREGCFQDVDLVIFACSSVISDRWVPEALSAGALVVDGSSAFRRSTRVPLWSPPLGELDATHRGLVSCPDGLTTLLAIALTPICELFSPTAVTVSSYEPASGLGRRAMDELRDQAISLFNFRPPPISILPRRLAFDLISVTEIEATAAELRRLIELPPISISRARVPTFIGIAAAIHLQLESPPDLDVLIRSLDEDPRIECIEGPLPSLESLIGQEQVTVAVQREQASSECFSLWVAADNLQTCAAKPLLESARQLLQIPSEGT